MNKILSMGASATVRENDYFITTYRGDGVASEIIGINDAKEIIDYSFELSSIDTNPKKINREHILNLNDYGGIHCEPALQAGVYAVIRWR